MYNIVKKYIAGLVSETIVSAIVINHKTIDTGTPCIFDLNHISLKRPSFEFDEILQKVTKNKEHRAEIINNTLLSDQHNVNSILQNVQATIIFPQNPQYGIGQKARLNKTQVYCTNSVPIINDSHISTTIDELSDITKHDTEALSPNKIIKLLKQYRYVNYELRNINNLNSKSILSMLNNMITMFSKKYPYKLCVYIYGNPQRILVDVLSISFYKMIDVMPIFDYKLARGIAIELFFTNSTCKAKQIETPHSYAVVRLVFSQYKDNLITIDGEQVHRSFQCSIKQAFDENITYVLLNSTPDVTALSRLKRKQKEINICAE